MRADLKTVFENLPEKFLANQLDELTDGFFRWRTIKNLRSKGLIPEACFVKISPRKIMILKAPFLEWAENYAYSKSDVVSKISSL